MGIRKNNDGFMWVGDHNEDGQLNIPQLKNRMGLLIYK